MFDREFIINYDFNDVIFYKTTPLIFTLTHIRNSTVQININLLLVHKFYHLLVFIVEKGFWF